MSNDNQAKAPQQFARPEPKPERAPRDVIPVAMLKFSDREPIDVPGIAGKSSVTAMALDKVIDPSSGKRINGSACWVVDYLPAIQHHRVVYFPPGGPAQQRMVHASNVKTWEPLG